MKKSKLVSGDQKSEEREDGKLMKMMTKRECKQLKYVNKKSKAGSGNCKKTKREEVKVMMMTRREYKKNENL